MACLIGLVVVTGFNSVARAEDHASTTTTTEHGRKHAKRLEHVGEWLTGFGIAHVIAGAPVLTIGAIASSTPQGDHLSYGPEILEFTGAMMTGIGASLLAVGLPLWIVGHVRDRHAERASAVALVPNGLALRF
jgi:hypothetical protein